MRNMIHIPIRFVQRRSVHISGPRLAWLMRKGSEEASRGSEASKASTRTDRGAGVKRHFRGEASGTRRSRSEAEQRR